MDQEDPRIPKNILFSISSFLGNKCAINNAFDPLIHRRMKHVDVDMNFIKSL